MVTTITTDLTPVPSRQAPSTFSSRMDTYLGKIADWTDEANAVAVEINDNATTAAAGAAAVDAEKWVSGTTYDEGDVVWSPINYKVYRRKSAGAGATDPSADSTNWAAIGGTGDVSEDSTQTLTNKTITLGDNTISGTVAQLNTAITDDDIVSLTATQTLTNKTITFANNTLTGVVGTNATQTLTNKTITLGDNTITGTIAQLNSVVTDDNIVSLTGSETLTNKTISASSNTLTGVVTLTGSETLTNKTLTSPVINSPVVTNEITALSGTTPVIGPGINTWTLSGNSTPTESLGNGNSATLHIANAGGYTITWSAVDEWAGGTAPDVSSSGTTVIELWQVSSTVYGAFVGVMS